MSDDEEDNRRSIWLLRRRKKKPPTSDDDQEEPNRCLQRKSKVYKRNQSKMERTVETKSRKQKRIQGPTLAQYEKAKTQNDQTEQRERKKPQTQDKLPMVNDRSKKSRRRKKSRDVTVDTVEEDFSQEETVGRSMKRTFKRFRDKSRGVMKTVMSKPLKDRSLKKMMKKVTDRQNKRDLEASEAGLSSSKPVHHLKEGDDKFPMRRPPDHKKGETAVEVSKKKKTSSSTDSSRTELSKRSNSSSKRTAVSEKSTKSVVSTRRGPEKKSIFDSEGVPFWQQKGEEDSDSELTDDELPMNADVILQVHSGKIKLAEMPRTKICLNPYRDLKEMKMMDSKFFTKDLIFSNTVRSMVNLVDDNDSRTSDSGSSQRGRSRDKKKDMKPDKRLKIRIPNKICLFDYDKPKLGGDPEPFTPGLNKDKD